MRNFLIPIMMGVVAAQAGCTSYVRVYEPLYPQRYSLGEFSYAARYGEMQVDVRGNPFSMIPERFADRVVAEMKGATRGPEVKFSTVPSGKGSAPYRVVMLFNGPPGDGDGGDRGIAGMPERVSEFRDGVELAIEYAKATGCKKLHAMAGVVADGNVTQGHLDTYTENVQYAADAVAPIGDEQDK